MNFSEIIKQPEGRRIEYKQELPSASDLAKSIVSFANDAGGELFIGIKDNPRQIFGVNEELLIKLEEKISNIIHDQCSPVILPEIIFHNIEGKYIIRIVIHKGSQPPYHLKKSGVDKGTYIRIGSSNRLASSEIIRELERQKSNISFDSELVFSKECNQIDINSLKNIFLKKTGEELSDNVLTKLELIKSEQGRELPTVALILLSDDELHKSLFPYSKIECALFKGTVPGNFIDQKTITGNVALQAEQAYQFVLRHISQGTKDYQGVYRNDRWEYPIVAIREVIRNAVIHRDYALTGKDIKIAIFDDKIEITSPGKLMPSVDYNLMDSGQSDIRNKILAPVFKKLGIIEQWGNGLRLIADELKQYPEIELDWKEPGLSFRVTFVNKNIQMMALQQEFEGLEEVGIKLGLSWDQVSTKLAPSQHQVITKSQFSWFHVVKLLQECENPVAISFLMTSLSWKDRSKFRAKYISPLLELDIIQMTIPDKPNSSNQQYLLTLKGKKLLDYLSKLLITNS